MAKVIGRDVTVFGLANTDANGSAGAVTGMLGRWESIEVTIDKDWADLTPSDAAEPEMRKTMDKWSASIKSFVDGLGSTALRLALNDYVQVVFTEVQSGATITLRGGIDKAGATFGQDNAKDSLDISSKGKLGGLASVTYA